MRHALGLWLGWALASAVGGALAGLIFSQLTPDQLLHGGWVLGGPALSLPQWLVLRPHLPRAVRWVLLTTVGAFIGPVIGVVIGLVASFLIFRDPSVLAVLGGSTFYLIVIVTTAGAGATVGLMQAIVLTRRLGDAAWWIVVSSPGGVLFGTPLALVAAGDRPLGDNPVILGLLGGATYGLTTSLALDWLVRNRRH